MKVTISLTYEEAVSLLNRAVAEKGADYVYDDHSEFGQCQNVNEAGEPSCIVGHVLHYAGMTEVPTFASIATLVGVDLVDMSSKTMHLLQLAQNLQDSGVSWGSAVQTAIKDAR